MPAGPTDPDDLPDRARGLAPYDDDDLAARGPGATIAPFEHLDPEELHAGPELPPLAAPHKRRRDQLDPPSAWFVKPPPAPAPALGVTIAPSFDSDDPLDPIRLIEPPGDDEPRNATLHTLYPDSFDPDESTDPDQPQPEEPAAPRAASAVQTTSGRKAAAAAQPAKELRPGTVLGRWVLEARIGEGATAAVWSAHHQQLGSPVAIKIFHRREMSFHTVLGEARAAAGIPSRNTIWVYDVDTLEGNHAIVMELCADGDRIAESLRVAPITDWRHAARLMSEAARGVEAAHDGAVFHKDIKPANILVNPSDGRAQITDFGLANPALWRARPSAKRREQHGTVAFEEAVDSPARAADPHAVIRGPVRVGTPEFMAPEQAEGLRNDIDPRNRVHRKYLVAIDVYGLGATLYALLADRPPYPLPDTPGEEVSAATIMAQVIAGPPTPLHDAAPHAPARLRKVVEKAMSRDPLERYESAAAFADDLDALIAEYPTSLDTSIFTRAAVHLHRQRVAVSMALFFTVLTVGSSAIVYVNMLQIAEQTSRIQEQTEELGDLERAHLAAQQSLGVARSQLSLAEVNLAKTRSDLNLKDGQLLETRSALDATSSELSSTAELLSATQQDLSHAGAQIMEYSSAVDDLRTRLAGVESAREAATESQQQLEASLSSVQQDLARLRAAYAAEVTRSADLAERAAELEARLRAGSDAVRAAQSVEAESRARIADSDARLREATARIRQLEEELARLGGP